jgi:glycosyltransferase involved in cell wall biosynthesis
MKIGIDISQIVYQTGVSRYTTELVKHILELDQVNDYFLYAGSLRMRSLIKTYLKSLNSKKLTSQITYLSPKFLNLTWNYLNLFPPDRRQALDLFHASNWALPKTRAKLVTTIHDLTFLKYPKTHTQYSVRVHTRHLNRAKKYADHIITDSESTKKDLIEYGFKDSKVSVIYPAPAKIFTKASNPKLITKTLAKYSLKEPFILSVGTQEPRKNIKRLIKAFKHLNSKYPKLSLAIAGKFGWGDTTQPIDSVSLLGFVPDEDLKILYQAAKVFVYPSLYEGFGFPILEAFKSGCPVITSNRSSLPELGGDAAFYLDPTSRSMIANTIDQVLSLSSIQRSQVIEKGLKQANKFNYQTTAQQTLNVYKNLTIC